jgi:hypothetical protein
MKHHSPVEGKDDEKFILYLGREWAESKRLAGPKCFNIYQAEIYQ